MRIVVVSSHFPPDFVSGGTLQPQRQARGLRALGHDVSVYAGCLDPLRPPLETWTEDDETGLPVRWIVTAPWTGWGDDNNWDNPAATDDFAAHLAEVRPDIVHFHSLQSLGAGVVPAAKRAGAKVVVTMHDFWWFCARQFLVDRHYHPCCLVIEAGNCACEVDRGWLEGRASGLRWMLSHADLVLAPSAAAADVLAANGVDPKLLRVEENGLPDPGPMPAKQVRPSSPYGTLRLLYVGGSLPMKGVGVLIDAARLLAAEPGWRLSAYGVEADPMRSGMSLDDLPIDVLPAFEPAEIDDVYAGADVLVLPSVMRESYSMATREALLRGVPVVCTETLGPEEVVDDGVNGLIVAPDDPAALAGAIRRLLREPHLLEKLRAGCAKVTVRPLADQIQSLDAIYKSLLTPAKTTKTSAKKPSPLPQPIAQVLFICGIEGATLRYRARLPAEALALLGVMSEVRHYHDPEVARLAAESDAVVFYRVPATVQMLALAEAVRRRDVPLFYDLDDLIFDPDVAEEIPALRILPAIEASAWLQGIRRYRTMMEACDVFIGSTGLLCRHATALTGLPSHRFDNGVGMLLGRMSETATRRPRRPGPLRIGYLSGSNTHHYDWWEVEPAVIEVLGRRPEVELWLGGHVNPSGALRPFAKRTRRLPIRPWTELPTVLHDLDVNLAPLESGSRFNESKSAIKWLEAALTATPTVASATEPFCDAIRNGENGYVARTLDDWVESLVALLDDDEARGRIGRRAQRDALLRWSPHPQGRRYREILESGKAQSGQDRPRGTSNWSPLVFDEPLSPRHHPLESYAMGELSPRPAPLLKTETALRVRNLMAMTKLSWQVEGPEAAARRVAYFALRRLRSARGAPPD